MFTIVGLLKLFADHKTYGFRDPVQAMIQHFNLERRKMIIAVVVTKKHLQSNFV